MLHTKVAIFVTSNFEVKITLIEFSRWRIFSLGNTSHSLDFLEFQTISCFPFLKVSPSGTMVGNRCQKIIRGQSSRLERRERFHFPMVNTPQTKSYHVPNNRRTWYAILFYCYLSLSSVQMHSYQKEYIDLLLSYRASNSLPEQIRGQSTDYFFQGDSTIRLTSYTPRASDEVKQTNLNPRFSIGQGCLVFAEKQPGFPKSPFIDLSY